MNKHLFLLFIPLLIVTVALIPSIPRANAALATGQVCLADPTTVNLTAPCPAALPIFNGPPPTTVTPPQVSPTQLLVGVYIQGSDVMNGFGVTLTADHTILKPADADPTGTVLNRVASPTVIAKCIGGIAKTGSCDATTDTVDTIHLAVAVLGGTTANPTTGLLFTAIYNITGTVAAGGITVGFQTGCLGTSLADGTCVTITNGGAVPGQPNVDPETVQAGSFDNSVAPPWVSISSSTATIGPIIGGGVSGTATITTSAQNGWPGSSANSISFTTQQTVGLTAAIASNCSPAACANTLTVSAAAGNYTVTVLGTYSTVASGMTSTLVAPVTIFVIVQDFSITSSFTSVNIPPNGQTYAAGTVTVKSLNGFSGSFVISNGNLAPAGLAVTYNPSSFTLARGATQVSTLSFSSTVMNRYLLTINAVSGSLSHATSVVKIPVNSFLITPSSSTISFNAGSTGSVTLTLQSYPTGNVLAGFAGTVTLTNSTALGLGPQAPCPASATLTAGASVTAICNFASTKIGTYTMTITGTGGFNNAITNSTTLTITVVPVFGFSASPTSVNVNATAAGTSTITASDLGGFSGTVALSYNAVPSTGLTCTFTPTSITVPSGGSSTSTLNCTGTTVGTYVVTVTGTATGASPKTVTVTYMVQDFSIAGGPASPNPVLTGATTSSTITVSPASGFTGTVSLVANAATGATCALSVPSQHLGNAFTSYLSCQSSTAGTYTVTVTGTSGALSHTTSVITFTVETFTISASNPTLVNVGASGTSTITVMGAAGSTHTVILSVSSSNPAGLTCTLASSVPVPPSATTSLSCSATVAGDYSVTVTGAIGGESHSTASILFHVADFTIAASAVTPTPISVSSTGTSTITLTRVNGFADIVALTATITPGTGLSASCSPQTLTGSIVSTCTFSASASGDYTVDIAGVDGSLSHHISFSVTVAAADFSLSASPTSITFTVGDSPITTVTVTALNGFSGSVSFGAFVTPSMAGGLDVTCAPQTITGATTSVCHFLSQTAGSYTVTIRGTSGDLSHSVTVNVTVNAISQVTYLGLTPTVFFASIGGVIAIVIVGSLVAFRRRASARRAKTPPASLQNRRA